MTGILIGLACGLGFAGILTMMAYNRLVMLGQRCDRAYADIDVQLRHRHDLIPSLVETVKGFASHERGIIDSLMSARAAAVKAAGPEEQARAEAALSSRLGQVFASVETYPEVKGSQHFAELRREIADVENKIAASRRFLNMAVSEHNATLAQFPAGLIGRTFGLASRRFFDLGLDRVLMEDAPAVRF
jgi:LemA protein